jgi:hypothetical protein
VANGKASGGGVADEGEEFLDGKYGVVAFDVNDDKGTVPGLDYIDVAACESPRG